MSFSNRVALIINSSIFERELRKSFSRRCDYEALLDFVSSEQADNQFNGKGIYHDLVCALYFYPLAIFRDNKIVQRDLTNLKPFLNALRNMRYEVLSAYTNVDSPISVRAIEAANSNVDTVVLLGVTIDHVPLLWHLKSLGKRVVTFASEKTAYEWSERIRDGLSWVYKIDDQCPFLGAKIETDANAVYDL